MTQPTLEELVKPFEPIRSVFLDLCDHVEAQALQFEGTLDTLTQSRLEMCLQGIRHPTIKGVAGEARPAFGALASTEGLTQLAGMGLMVNARLNQHANDVIDSGPIVEAVGNLLTQYNYPAWLVTTRDIDNYHGVSDAIAIANAGRHLTERPTSIPECRQERMAMYLHKITEISNGQIAPPTQWDAFDPRGVRVYLKRPEALSEGNHHNAWVDYGSRQPHEGEKRVVRIGPFPSTQLNGGQKEMVETMRKTFYHGSPEHELPPLTDATPRQLEDKVRDGLVQLISEKNPAWEDRYNDITSLADQFYAYVGEPQSMPSRQGRGVPSSAGAPGLA